MIILYIVIEKRNEIEILNHIRKIHPNIIVENNICEFKPTVDGLIDTICDYCKHDYYDNGCEQCKIKDEKL